MEHREGKLYIDGEFMGNVSEFILTYHNDDRPRFSVQTTGPEMNAKCHYLIDALERDQATWRMFFDAMHELGAEVTPLNKAMDRLIKEWQRLEVLRCIRHYYVDNDDPPDTITRTITDELDFIWWGPDLRDIHFMTTNYEYHEIADIIEWAWRNKRFTKLIEEWPRFKGV